MHKIVHAFHAALLVWAIRMVEESADDQFALEVVWIELPQLSEDVGEFLVGLGEWLHPGFERLPTWWRWYGADVLGRTPFGCPFTKRALGCCGPRKTQPQ